MRKHSEILSDQGLQQICGRTRCYGISGKCAGAGDLGSFGKIWVKSLHELREQESRVFEEATWIFGGVPPAPSSIPIWLRSHSSLWVLMLFFSGRSCSRPQPRKEPQTIRPGETQSSPDLPCLGATFVCSPASPLNSLCLRFLLGKL